MIMIILSLQALRVVEAINNFFPFFIKQNLRQQQQQQTSQLKVVSVKHKQKEKLTKEGFMDMSYTK